MGNAVVKIFEILYCFIDNGVIKYLTIRNIKELSVLGQTKARLRNFPLVLCNLIGC